MRDIVYSCDVVGSDGTIDDPDEVIIAFSNQFNKSYQSCYKAKGFPEYLWSSDDIRENDRSVINHTKSTAWLLDFSKGRHIKKTKDTKLSIRCVRLN